MSSRSERPATVGGAAGGQRVELGVTRLAQSDTGHANGAAAAPMQDEPRPERSATDFSAARSRYRVSVEEYVRFLVDGFLIVRGLVGPEEVQELLTHTEDLVYGRVDVPGLEPPPPGASVAEIERRYLRIHMLHQHLEIHERFLLHPRILDVLEALIGPDVMAMQTMLFSSRPVAPAKAIIRTATTSLPIPTRSAAHGWRWSGRMKKTAVCGSRAAPSTSRSTPVRTG